MRHRSCSHSRGFTSAQGQVLEMVAERVGSGAFHVSKSRRQLRERGDLAQRLHANARVALIISLMSVLFPLALPVGLFLGWRVRAEAMRSMPGLVEWVSLPFYVASFGLWLGAAASLFGLSVVSLMWLR